MQIPDSATDEQRCKIQARLDNIGILEGKLQVMGIVRDKLQDAIFTFSGVTQMLASTANQLKSLPIEVNIFEPAKVNIAILDAIVKLDKNVQDITKSIEGRKESWESSLKYEIRSIESKDKLDDEDDE